MATDRRIRNAARCGGRRRDRDAHGPDASTAAGADRSSRRGDGRDGQGNACASHSDPARAFSLPFLASHVTFDDESRDLDPPTDVAAFDARLDGGTRHHVTILAPDGTRAEGYAVEEDGIIRAEGDGYTFAAPAQPDDTPRAMRKRATHPLGTVHNGFTKLH